MFCFFFNMKFKDKTCMDLVALQKWTTDMHILQCFTTRLGASFKTCNWI